MCCGKPIHSLDDSYRHWEKELSKKEKVEKLERQQSLDFVNKPKVDGGIEVIGNIYENKTPETSVEREGKENEQV